MYIYGTGQNPKLNGDNLHGTRYMDRMENGTIPKLRFCLVPGTRAYYPYWWGAGMGWVYVDTTPGNKGKAGHGQSPLMRLVL